MKYLLLALLLTSCHSEVSTAPYQAIYPDYYAGEDADGEGAWRMESLEDTAIGKDCSQVEKGAH